MAAYVRRAAHAGSWYSANGEELNRELGGYMDKAVAAMPKAVAAGAGRFHGAISPHAGFRHSGQTAAFAHAILEQTLRAEPCVARVFVLHPSHHVAFCGAVVPGATKLETPLGDLDVCASTVAAVTSHASFPTASGSPVNREADEEEHSAEMMYPFMKLAMQRAGRDVPVVPVMVGQTSSSQEGALAQVLRDYRDTSFFVLSSDFCHWGARFGYTPMRADGDFSTAFQFIEELDHRGYDEIASGSSVAFREYLNATNNSICGARPILSAMELGTTAWSKLHYSQSGAVRSARDSSVSYLSAAFRVE